MIFIHTEKSKRHEVANVLATIYDGTSKPYPNGTMLLFIPLYDNIQYDASYRQKVLYNHEQYLGDEEGVSIYGMQDLDMLTVLKNQQHITIRFLLRSLPATQGMSRPQLFQLAETNETREAIVVTYQREDREHVQSRLITLQNDILAQLAPGEASRIFISETEGISFRPLSKTKGGHIIYSQQTSQHTLSHIQHTKSILSSPPKKRPYTSSTTGTTQVHQQTVQNHPPLANQSPSQPNPNYAAATQRRSPSAPYIQQNSTEIRTPRVVPTQNNDNDFKEAINNRFLLVEEELKEQKRWNNEQREWNEDMLLRMNYIEDTTTSTDCKVDTILSRLDSWDIPTKRRGISTNNNEGRSAPYPHLQDTQGDMER